jgi:hypothetical protein
MVFGGIARELHNHVDGLSCFRMLQLWRELSPRERKIRNQDQHQYAEALSPCGAMAFLPACWLAFLSCLFHGHPFDIAHFTRALDL